jgi:class 3 adenylate cyclase
MVGERPDRVERRLAAIVAADVAGYSRLMGIDEIGTARTLREHRAVTDALVAKHGGRIVKTTGDGVLIEFPSVVDAVECAVAAQAVIAERNAGVAEDRRMLFRVGINLGDVLVQGDDDILGTVSTWPRASKASPSRRHLHFSVGLRSGSRQGRRRVRRSRRAEP